MSSASSKTPEAPDSTLHSGVGSAGERRANPRRRFDRLTYAEFGPHNGGILIDLSESGSRFQSVEPVAAGALLPVRFVLTGSVAVIKAAAKVMWCNESGKGGGLRFVDLSEDARHQIGSWVESEPTPAVAPNGNSSNDNGRTKYNLLTTEGHATSPEPASDAAALAMARLLVSARGSAKLGVKPDAKRAPTDTDPAMMAALDPDARPEALTAHAPAGITAPSVAPTERFRVAIADEIPAAGLDPRHTELSEAPEPAVVSDEGVSAATVETIEASPVLAGVADIAAGPLPAALSDAPAIPDAVAPSVVAELVAPADLDSASTEVSTAPEAAIESHSEERGDQAPASFAPADTNQILSDDALVVVSASDAQTFETSEERAAEALVEAEEPQPAGAGTAAAISAVSKASEEATAVGKPALLESEATSSKVSAPVEAAPSPAAPTSAADAAVASAPKVLASTQPAAVSTPSVQNASAQPSGGTLIRDTGSVPNLPYSRRKDKQKHKQKQPPKPAPANPMGLPSLLAPPATSAIPTRPAASSVSVAAPTLLSGKVAPQTRRVIPRWGEQVLKFSVGVGVGCCLVAGTFVGIRLLGPGHRAFSLAHARPEAVEAAAAPALQPLDVEVLDLAGRRWRLSDAESERASEPIEPQPPTVELTPEESATARAASAVSAPSAPAKPAAPVTPKATVRSEAKPQPRRKSESASLALKRPLTGASAPNAANGEQHAPSIFEGIAPVISQSLALPEPHAPAPAAPAAPGATPVLAPATVASAPAPGPASSQTVFPTVTSPTGTERASKFQAPVLLEQVAPVYPPQAKAQHITGTVRINAVIGKEGIPHTLRVMSGDARLAPAAIAAVSEWLYRPAQLNGEDIDSEVTIDVQFQLN